MRNPIKERIMERLYQARPASDWLALNARSQAMADVRERVWVIYSTIVIPMLAEMDRGGIAMLVMAPRGRIALTELFSSLIAPMPVSGRILRDVSRDVREWQNIWERVGMEAMGQVLEACGGDENKLATSLDTNYSYDMK